MPIQHAIWKIAETPVPLKTSRLVSEKLLHEMILRDTSILSSEWMVIGSEKSIGNNNRFDLLAIEPDGSLVLIELKRDRTPREVVAQAIDYASWVQDLTADEIAQIYLRFSGGTDLATDFKARFKVELDEDSLNASHQIIIVAAELDGSTERIIQYLNDRDIAINAMLFQVFQNGDEQFLSRAWLIDPIETQANVASTAKGAGEKEPWNGEFYVSYGFRDWNDAQKYGFVSAGGGSWYSQTLKMLQLGSRIWVKIPKTGYTGVGVVTETYQPMRDMTVETPNGIKPAFEILKDGPHYQTRDNDPDKAEYAVRVRWLDTVSETKAIDEVGLFGNQNTVCKPRTTKWSHTIERLKTHFKKWNLN